MFQSRRKNPHFPRRGQKKFLPKRPQLVGQFTGVKVGDRVVGVANGTLVGDWLVDGIFTGDETGSTGTSTILEIWMVI